MDKKFFKVCLLFIIFVFGLMQGGLLLAMRESIQNFSESTFSPKKEAEGENIPIPSKKAEEDIMPNLEFKEPKNGSTLKGSVVFKGRVENAQSVEFYYKLPGSENPFYFGNAKLVGDNEWQLEYDTKLIPNGEYEIFPKITNQYGEYKGEKIKVKIDNEIRVGEDKKEEIIKNVEDLKKEIKDITKKAEEKKQEIIKEISGEDEKPKKAVENFDKKVEQQLELEKEIAKIEKEKPSIEEKIKRDEEALKRIEKIPAEKRVKIIEEEKKKKLENEMKTKEEIEKKVDQLKTELEKVKMEKENIANQIIESSKKNKEEVSNLVKRVEEVRKEIDRLVSGKMEILTKDSDEDGLSDEEEVRLGTNPLNPDSDGDGFLDGVEVTAGYNPSVPGPADKIIYQDPEKVPPKKTDIYQVERVEKVVLERGEIGIKLVGRGLPNSFLTLYIFSSPIIVIVKTNEKGQWKYVLDKPIKDGEHRVYVALTNNRGEIEARSEVFAFMKAGIDVFRIFEAQTEAISPVETLKKPFFLLVLAAVIFAISIVVAIVSLSARQKVK